MMYIFKMYIMRILLFRLQMEKSFVLMLAFAGYFSVILTIMRRQSLIMAGYIIAAVLALLVSDWIVENYQIMGAAVFYALLMAALAVCFYFMYKIQIC